jgi:hypothetical protein
MERTFDRLPPSDWVHYEKYPLQALPLSAQPSRAPLVWGINWYGGFDDPVYHTDGRWWVRDSLGSVRGGHAIASPTPALPDSKAWWEFYDQGREGACVGFSISRMATWYNRRRYDARWLYKEAQEVDEWPGEDYEGTSVRAGLNVLRQHGHRRVERGKSGLEQFADGIDAYRWINSAEEAIRTIGNSYASRIGAIPWCNSWGRSYPRTVWVPGEIVDRLLNEDGECAVVTDR